MIGRAIRQGLARMAAGGREGAEPAADAEPALLRPARRGDARAIAELFQISSDGVADYIWTTLSDEYPGLEPIEIGEQRYRREDTGFSYQNCLVIEQGASIIGMMHAFPIAPADDMPAENEPEPGDPVLRPYAELEAPGSLYISAMAVRPGYRGQGNGRRLLEAARQRARALGCERLSLLCFAGNTEARRLYEREGFSAIDRRPVVPHPLIRHTGEVLLMTAPA